jgi:hypothetical protein
MRMRHIVICDLSGSTIFFLIIWRTSRFSKKKLLNMKCVFWFSLRFLSETFLILRRIERDMVKTVYWSSCKVLLFACPTLTKLEFSRQIFEKYSNIKIHENRFNGSGVVPCGQTGRHDEANNRYCNFANGTTNSVFCVKRSHIYTDHSA